ncbi:MAG TPA: TonB C-terminal domain-containing protein, partial [Chthoniobacterales bacterium]|nr:TonB C-terminal domain-containing protein [Chthoniobacterales bacterium]
MPKNFRFWTNVTLIAAGHAAIIFGLVRWSRAEKDSQAQNVMWLGGGGGEAVALAKANPPEPRKESRTDSHNERELEKDQPVLASAPSDIQLPTPTPIALQTPAPKAATPPKPTASPKVKGTPKPKPKPRPTAKPTPKPSPKKLVLAKASPKPSVRETSEKEESEPAEAPVEKTEVAKSSAPKEEPKPSDSIHNAVGKGTTAGSGGGHLGGSANAGQFAWYGSMLHDRFYSEWVQPTDVASAGAKNSVLVKLRIEKNGRISSFEIVRPSGNAEL